MPVTGIVRYRCWAATVSEHCRRNFRDYKLEPGAFAENVLVDGITVYRLPVGTRLALGETAEAEVTQIGKQCHNDCVIRQKAGDCVMPREGIFVKIVKPGFLKAGDTVRVIGESENRANNSRKY